MKQKLAVSWDAPNNDSKLRQFKRYLRDKGARPSTVDDYLSRVKKYFEFCGDKEPSLELAQEYRDDLLDRNLSNSSVANYSYAIKNFHKMLGQDSHILSALTRSLTFSHLQRQTKYLIK